MSSDNKKQLESGFTDLEENQNDENQKYIDMTKALIFSLALITIGLVAVIAEIWVSSFA